MSNGAAEIRRRARAKVNLYLHITGRRDDGYHELESLFVFADVGDELRFTPADAFSLSLDGAFAASLGDKDDNLVLKAAAALQKALGSSRQAHIELTKNLPVAAGIGGGSADAAATLLGLQELWRLPLAEDKLLELALSLGADVPACLTSHPIHVSGIGEVIAEIGPFPPVAMVLANPGEVLETADVFAAYRNSGAAFSRPVPIMGRTIESFAEFAGILRNRRNELQPIAEELCPAIKQVIESLEETAGCAVARMSGSGATCFGVYETLDAARKAAGQLREKHPGWWVKAASVLG